MPLLELNEVTRSFDLVDREPLQILKGVNLVVEEGDHISIVGRSGSGKSTLLNLLGLLDNPSTGTIQFDGVSIAKLSGSERAKARGKEIGFVFQQFNLLQRRTALDNVIMPLLYSEGEQFWKRRELAAYYLERVGLGERKDHLVDRLSGGEQQRVAIARALVRNPRMILSDEPTGALDLNTGNTVMGLLEEVAKESNAALVTITHDVNIALRAKDYYLLDQGVLNKTELKSQLLAPVTN